MEGRKQKPPVTKRSVVIARNKSSISLGAEFWDALQEIATARGMTTAKLVSCVDADRQHNNRSSAIRLFVLNHYRQKQ
jgi:predicted DNA-binding ribbon-helix-helix protein